MTADALRRLLTDADLKKLARAKTAAKAEVALWEILERLSGRAHAIDTSPSSRPEIARRAAALLFGTHPHRWTLGGAAHAKETARPIDKDGRLAARALAIALRESAFLDTALAQETLQRESGGTDAWERALRASFRTFVANARASGATRKDAVLRTLAAAASLTGEASSDAEVRDLAADVGRSAARFLRTPLPASREAAVMRRLAQALSEINDQRLTLWEGAEGESTRRLGAAACRALFGHGATRLPVTHVRAAPAVDDGKLVFADGVADFPETWRERLSLLDLDSAREALEEIAHDPRTPEDERETAWKLAEALDGHPSSDAISFGTHLSYETTEARTADMRAGTRLRFAVPRGRHAARLFCGGRNGRTMRCRAVADTQGALVGYLGFDALSREFGGRPLYAAYDLDGRRKGYAWADQPTVARLGMPKHGFMTAPETIPIS